MKISALFYVLAALEIIALLFYFFGSEASGAGVFAAFIGAGFVLAAIYNRMHNGTWFTDFSGGK